MPKIYGTRKEKARELLDRLKRGPSWSTIHLAGKSLTEEEATRQYKMWSESWILEDVVSLVPELRKRKEEVR